jgi:predicted Zn finger-like uncharacterized protein
MVTTTCPSCKVSLKIAEEIIGKTVKCPKCQHQFVAPGSDDVPDPSPIDVSPSLPNPLDDLVSQVAFQQPPQGYAPVPRRAAKPIRPIQIPNYGAVKFIGKVLEIFGYIDCFLVVLVLLLCLVCHIIGASGNNSAVSAILVYLGGSPVVAWFGVCLVFGGIIDIGLAQLLYCTRDMARNSFYLQRL